MRNFDNTLILCSTQRLRRALIQKYPHTRVNLVFEWLIELFEDAFLCGDVPSYPKILSDIALDLFWRRAIEATFGENEQKDFFNIPALVKNAIEADRYCVEYGISLQDKRFVDLEASEFLKWQKVFLRLCHQFDVQDQTRAWQWFLNHFAQIRRQLPSRIEIYGFDLLSPQLQKLLDLLRSKGIDCVCVRNLGIKSSQNLLICNNQQDECLRFVAWLKKSYEENPQAKFALIAPGLGKLRETLSLLLDEAFQPLRLKPSGIQTGLKFTYNFSEGENLSRIPLVSSALITLKLMFSPIIVRENLLAVFLNPYILRSRTSGVGEDDWDLLVRKVKEHLPETFTLQDFERFIQYISSSLPQHLLLPSSFFNKTLQDLLSEMKGAFYRQNMSIGYFVDVCNALLDKLYWSRGRSLNSHEQQAKERWSRLLDDFKCLDVYWKKTKPSEIMRMLSDCCGNVIFQAETANISPQLQIVGQMDALANPVSAIWVMGMNQHLFPNPPQINPFVPIELQRELCPHSTHPKQLVFAEKIWERIIASTETIIISYARSEEGQALLPSGLVSHIPVVCNEDFPSFETFVEAWHEPVFEFITDDFAPEMLEQESVRSGVDLFKRFMICPAWAFYQNRLNASSEQDKPDYFDALSRGNLIHKALSILFIKGKNLSEIQKITATEIANVVHNLLTVFKKDQIVPFSEVSFKLEQKRLQFILERWLRVEQNRKMDFTVAYAEHPFLIEIAPLKPFQVRVDRIDRFMDAGLLIIDYKTGNGDPKKWHDLKEPQLPIYALYANLDAEISGISFANVGLGETEKVEFKGLSLIEGIVGDLQFKTLRKMPTYSELLDLWKEKLDKTAVDIQRGYSAVIVADEHNLEYCEVLPILRLAERRWQYERL